MNEHFIRHWATYAIIIIIVAFFMDKLSFFEATLLVMLALLVDAIMKVATYVELKNKRYEVNIQFAQKKKTREGVGVNEADIVER